MSKSIFDIQNVTFFYDDQRQAINDLTITIGEGVRAAILGANGSGKSTLLRLLDALYFPQKGTITAFGREITEESMQDEQTSFSFRRRVGLIFQNPDVQLFNPTVFDEVAFGPLQMRWPKDRIRERVAEVLELLDIWHLKDRAPHRLSGGEKKRVAIASVLILDPEVILLDEPTTGLDPKSQGQVIDFLVGWGGGSKTVVTATHDLGILEEIADKCFVLENGSLAKEGSPSEILSDTALLERTNLIHSHRHKHPDGKFHSHPHIHKFHEHIHDTNDEN